VPAGEFDTDKTTDGRSSNWICRKTGLVVKTEFENGVIELTEYDVK
jgi:hypothetical protein